jgi:cytochrome c553
MKATGIRLALQLALLAIVVSAESRAQDAAIISQGAIQAKAQDCYACHGLSAQGRHGPPPVPRLAGQRTVYIENQLEAFAERRRSHQSMSNVSDDLSPPMRAALAKHFNELTPDVLAGAPSELIAAGKKIYDEGVPGKAVRCGLCHGSAAQGDGGIPRLAGQVYQYVVHKLLNWRQERGLDPVKRDAASIMEPVVHGLTKPQIEAVAAYVSALK